MYKLKSQFNKSVRAFFENQGYIEVETPIVVKMPGTEVYLDYFQTKWKDISGQTHDLFLRSSPEIHMKKILCSGYDKIFQISKCFRNKGELSEWHHPEFNMLEWYQTNISFDEFIQQTIDFLSYTCEQMKSVFSDDIKIKVPKKFERFTMREAFKEFAKIDLIDNDEDLASKAKSKGVNSVQPNDDFETAYFKTIIEKIEPALEKLEFSVLTDYPESQAALAHTQNGVAKRFEIYVGRIELCNAFWELTDPLKNKQRIWESNDKRLKLNLGEVPVDEDFLELLQRGLPPTCGNALGLDRWLALMTGQSSVAPFVPFRYEYESL